MLLAQEDEEGKSGKRKGGCCCAHQLCDLGPAVAVNLLSFHDQHVFILRPRALHDVWVELVVPALANLLARPVWEERGDEHPALVAVLVHKLPHLLVLLCMRARS
eukprot:275476-Rhodomonas_salina.1